MELPFVVPDPPQPVQASAFPTSDTSTDRPSISPPASHKIPRRGQDPPLPPPPQVVPSLTQQQNGGLLYSNLIPGHYRYGAMPPPPPPGPLSLQSSGSSHHNQYATRATPAVGEQSRPQHTAVTAYSNVPNYHPSRPTASSSNRQVLQVSEPDEDDDDLLVIAASDMMDDVRDENDDDDETLYRPFRHTSNSALNANACNAKMDRSASHSTHNKDSSRRMNTAQTKDQPMVPRNTTPIDLLTVLLGGSPHDNDAESTNQDRGLDLSKLIEEATTKSRNARALTDALATKQNDATKATNETMTHSGADNDFYVHTANAHTEAALSFQRVYRALLGFGEDSKPASLESIIHQQTFFSGGLSPSEELAKSMLILANGHVRMAASLANMGVKWNMGKAESFRMAMAKNHKQVLTAAVPEARENSQAHSSGATSSNENDDRNHSIPQHERLRMAVRGALDTANHEEDITNSTFLARSTFLRTKASDRGGKSAVGTNPTAGGSGGNTPKGPVANEGNAVDDLMKLEKELKGMDMALEVGTSVSSLGAAVSSRPDGSFCVVPPGSSYMSSSYMWSSGIMGVVGGGNPPLTQQQQSKYHDRVSLKSPSGTSGVRSKANHLQNFLGGGRPPTNTHPLPPTASIQSNPKADQATTNAGLDQSWWGGGQGSMIASVALSTVTASHQKSSPYHGSTPTHPRAESANTKQLMQLMDSLNRLGNENAQLMREVEEAKAARAEAVAAKNMMEQFKKEYSQRFLKVKEALEKYPRNASDNPVNNSSYMKSASMMELQKRDQMIKKLAADLRKEREETKKKDAALRKYEGFYREVKARSAEKARQRQLQEEQKKAQQLQQQG